MKLQLVLFLSLGCGLISPAQEDSTAIPFVSYWSPGDSYDFRVTKIKKDWRGKNITKDDSSAYVTNFYILDSTENSYRIRWRFKTNFSEYNIPEEMVSLFSKYELTEVIYETSEVGEFRGIENWEEIGTMMKELFSDLTTIISKEKDLDREVFENALKPIISIYESKQGVEQWVFKELQYFHFPFGVEFPSNEAIYYEEAMPNMLGGKPIRGDVKLYVDSVNYEEFYCKLNYEMEINPEDAREVILAFFKQTQLENEEVDEMFKKAIFDIRDSNSYEYYYLPGIPIRIEAKRESTIDIAEDKGRRLEITRIELMD